MSMNTAEFDITIFPEGKNNVLVNVIKGKRCVDITNTIDGLVFNCII